MAFRPSIRGQMLLLIALPTLLIYVLVLGLMMSHLRGANRADVEQQMTRRAASYAAQFDAAFREVAAIAITTARFMEARPDVTEDEIYAQLESNVRQNPMVYGAAMAFEPGAERAGHELFCPYVYRGPDGMTRMNLDRAAVDWYGEPEWQWWHAPKATGGAVWTDPYFDEGAGNVLMVTYAVPFVRDGTFRGVTTVDVMLPTLGESVGRGIVDDLRFGVFNGRGQFVYSDDPSRIMSSTVFERAEELGLDIADELRDMVEGGTGVIDIDGANVAPGDSDAAMWSEPQWVFYAPIESPGWAFLAILPEREALAGVRARMTQGAIGLTLTLALIIVCIWFVSGHIAAPLGMLRGKVMEIAGGDLDARVEDIGGASEIAELGSSFNKMTADLRDHVDHLAFERASREKIERDLDLAREIQVSLLPTAPPTAPGFEIAGWNRPADQTGGDYFDWLDMPDGRIIITLADVTGHGIGPALIVSVCRAYMRASASTGGAGLAEAMTRANDLLHADIPANRFVTAAVGVLTPEESRLDLVSAGQAPLLFYEAATGTVHNWDADVLPLGIMGGVDFDDPRVVRFASGDLLLLTTDGFMEWPDPDGRQFGSDGLEAFLREHHALTPDDLIAKLYEAVLAHARGVEQGDDLTALVIKRT
jgi:sigma-B regulation protein RsbU (phosphoserine phosphatase)